MNIKSAYPSGWAFLCKRILAKIDRDLITIDPTWGSGYVKDDKFIAKYDKKYLVPNRDNFENLDTLTVISY